MLLLQVWSNGVNLANKALSTVEAFSGWSGYSALPGKLRLQIQSPCPALYLWPALPFAPPSNGGLCYHYIQVPALLPPPLQHHAALNQLSGRLLYPTMQVQPCGQQGSHKWHICQRRLNLNVAAVSCRCDRLAA